MSDLWQPSLYLAGPEVFRPDALAEGERLKAICRDLGALGLYPLQEGEVADADEIRAHCIGLIGRADALVADISPFRGVHMDPGTAFEIGYAEALGLPVFLWSSDSRDLVQRIAADPRHGAGRDAEGHLIEDFARPENLMIVRGDQKVHAAPQDAIAEAVAALSAAAGRRRDEARHRAIHHHTRMMVLAALAASLAAALAAGPIIDWLTGR
ncbi:nucleoside 2-deoxyribosyltransferase [Ancylobacter oerskovii]|uniref:Nucleoside 2-deoxyribosyltransferase n=1 Tax=Ancylobacter oerskovii TaxID=459519 RepID=A0ABW4Z3H0_9HYPH|nr:nucleoside 2-deoxyribosyltransferase [Ancylobacter oerskovii]MBS7546142.1 nucleoside 2-deoxyribosyltransferase [Ancylobacter oerskovii]